eukprot:2658882-Rhodomonas_salina.2
MSAHGRNREGRTRQAPRGKGGGEGWGREEPVGAAAGFDGVQHERGPVVEDPEPVLGPGLGRERVAQPQGAERGAAQAVSAEADQPHARRLRGDHGGVHALQRGLGAGLVHL